MTRSLVAFISRVVRSHIGHVLLAVSWSFILFVFIQRPLADPQFVGCTPVGGETFTNAEILRVYPIWIGITVLAHFPSILATMAITTVFQKVFSLSCAPTAKVELLLFFFFSAIQWLLLGYIIETPFRRWRSYN
jgi:hypothetical protein